jgi:hypothetical protein
VTEVYGVDPVMVAALAPVTGALLAAAKAEAAQRMAAANAMTAQTLARAQSRVDSALASARAAAAADAAGASAAERARGRREARAVVLAAHREAVEALLAAARDAAAKLVNDPEYPGWRDRLAAQAVQALGPEAVVREEPEGGVVAVAGARRIDLRLPGLAEQAVAELGVELGLAPEGAAS